MDNSKTAILKAKITYFFKETFRAHSRSEYKEILSRGLNEDNGGMSGAFPFLYVRAFFALLLLFTVNTLVLRLTNNTLYVPSVTFVGGITFSVPFIILLYELYPKRDISLLALIAMLVIGGTSAGVIAQLCYSLIKVENVWLSAVCTGIIEEVSKAIPSLIIILVFRQKNPYACFLLAAAVGTGFSAIEDMGYIFFYSDKYAFNYHSDIQATVAMFADRGLSAFCTHILWSGLIGWAYSISKKPFRSVWLVTLAVCICLHICWDLPLDGALKIIVLIACIVIVAAISITVVHKSRINTIAEQVDLRIANEIIIDEALSMGDKMRFKNAANLTLAITCTLLSVIVLLLCALPIGIDYQTVDFDSKERFIAALEGGYYLNADFTREYDENGKNVVELWSYGDDGEMELTYAEQEVRSNVYDGVYYYAYYMDDKSEPYDIFVELDSKPYRIQCVEYEFGDKTERVFEVNNGVYKEYTCHKDGSVTAVIDAEEFEGYDYLIGLCATACAITMGCAVILVAFTIKIRRLKNERL